MNLFKLDVKLNKNLTYLMNEIFSLGRSKSKI